MKCPKCGFEGSIDDECPACGVVISKFIQAQKKNKPEDNALRDLVDKEDISTDLQGDSDIIAKTLAYGWIVFTNLLTIAVVVAIYSVVSSTFEIIVVSLIIFTYLRIVENSMTYGDHAINFMFALNAEFIRIRKLLNEETDLYEIEMLNESKEKADKARIEISINAAFLLIIYIITLWNLILVF